MNPEPVTARESRFGLFRNFLSVVILGGFLGWATWYVTGNSGLFRPLMEIGVGDLVALLMAFLVIMVCNGFFICIVSRPFEIRLRAREWLSLSFASSFANFFLPFRGGAGIRAVYMYRMYRFPVSEFVSTLGIMYLMHIVVNALLALAGMLAMATKDSPANPVLLVLFSTMAIAGTLAMITDFDLRGEQRGFPLAQLSRLLVAWRKVRQDHGLVLRLWLLMLALTAATVCQCLAAFRAVGIDLAAAGVVVYAACKNLASLIGLTPGSLGIVEMVSIYLGRVLGYGTADALLVQGLIRAVSIVVLLLAAPVALIYLRRRMRSAAPRSTTIRSDR